MSLRASYTLLAPLYDIIVKRATSSWRTRSIQQLDIQVNDTVLLNGVGTGLDLAHLPDHAHYIAADLTFAMLKRAKSNADNSADRKIDFHLADACKLPYKTDSFDCIVLHLILAVVSTPHQLLIECERVLKPGGKITIVDKFLKPEQKAPFRRLLNFFTRHIATRMDVVFEEVLKSCPSLSIISDTPLQPGSWFRNILLAKD